ncbi:hypothetical protein JW824_00275 [bacterium]|nr:hypothetical protein [bacterium]RQV99318.1 MAG: hypothetical protein EH221_00305 [bacterium]
MPQLVKGGKHVFGWSRVGAEGQIVIPPDALEEYHFKNLEKLILIPGSRTSGGFGLVSRKSVSQSPLSVVLDVHPELVECRIPEGDIIEYRKKPYCWVKLNRTIIRIPSETLKKFGIGIGDRLLVIRGSGLALGFAVRGPIVTEAKKHNEIKEYL